MLEHDVRFFAILRRTVCVEERIPPETCFRLPDTNPCAGTRNPLIYRLRSTLPTNVKACHSPYLETFFFFFSSVSICISTIHVASPSSLIRPFVCERAITFIRLNEHFQRSVAIRETRSVRRPSQFRGHDTLDGGGLRENRV